MSFFLSFDSKLTFNSGVSKNVFDGTLQEGLLIFIIKRPPCIKDGFFCKNILETYM